VDDRRVVVEFMCEATVTMTFAWGFAALFIAGFTGIVRKT
jgi:hypothetical protein